MGNVQLHPKRRKINIEGFIVEASHKRLTQWIFKTHPETATNVRSQNPELRTTYMNILFGIIKTLCHKPLRDLTEAELDKASKYLSDLTDAGFDLDWLKSKVEKASLEKKTSEARVLELKEEVKKLVQIVSDLEVERKIEKKKLKKKPSWISKNNEISGGLDLHITF